MDTRSRLRLTGPGDLVVGVPYLLGFIPQDSLVVVSLDASREVALVARVDLPPLDDAEGALIDETSTLAAAGIGDEIGAAALRSGAVAVVALAYPPDGAGGTDWTGVWRGFAERLRDAFAAHDLETLDVLGVSRGRWWSLLCSDSNCCPEDGTAVPATGVSEVEARATAAGLVVAPSRAAVAAALEPAPAALRRAVEAAIADRASTELDRAAALDLVDQELDRWAGGARELGAAPAAAVLVAVGDVVVRDAVSWRPDDGDAAMALWSELVRLAPPRWLPNAGVLLAAAAYQQGRGLLARIALDLALEADPEHVLAGRLSLALSSGVPPGEAAAVFRAGADDARERIGQMP
jgi:hypothetical protein